MVGFPAVLKVARALMTSQLDGTQDINSAWVKKFRSTPERWVLEPS